jgi:hypothetical protein
MLSSNSPTLVDLQSTHLQGCVQANLWSFQLCTMRALKKPPPTAFASPMHFTWYTCLRLQRNLYVCIVPLRVARKLPWCFCFCSGSDEIEPMLLQRKIFMLIICSDWCTIIRSCSWAIWVLTRVQLMLILYGSNVSRYDESRHLTIRL